LEGLGPAGSVTVHLPELTLGNGSNPTPPEWTRVAVVSRPEKWRLTVVSSSHRPSDVEATNSYMGRVKAVLFAGSYTEYVVELDGDTVNVWTSDAVVCG